MPTYKSADEVAQEFTAKMGPMLGPYFHALYEEVIWLKDKWREFRELYGTSEARVDLLNEAAPYFFGALHDALFENTLLHLSRLTDSPTMRGGKENLSMRGLEERIEDEEIRAEVVRMVAEAVKKCGFARDWRNRHIAHRDRALALDDDATALAFASRGSVEDAIAAIEAIVRWMHVKYMGSDILLDLSGTLGDATDLLRVLQEGVAAHNAREKRMEAGQWTAEDLEPRPAI